MARGTWSGHWWGPEWMGGGGGGAGHESAAVRWTYNKPELLEAGPMEVQQRGVKD